MPTPEDDPAGHHPEGGIPRVADAGVGGRDRTNLLRVGTLVDHDIHRAVQRADHRTHEGKRDQPKLVADGHRQGEARDLADEVHRRHLDRAPAVDQPGGRKSQSDIEQPGPGE